MANTLQLKDLKELVEKAQSLTAEQKSHYISALEDGTFNESMSDELHDTFRKEAGLLHEQSAEWASEIEKQKEQMKEDTSEMNSIVEQTDEEAQKEVQNMKNSFTEIEKAAEDEAKKSAQAYDQQDADAIRKKLGLK